ncbi:MAG TPA: sigma-70 family RNA polymerase sigma factor [Prosthecobacter sp.]|nr:sigma-70 family RNA polymerase sigma factor [Prosthecobacter sp.]HRK13934.1 sigma-70 family RNA polymerase sigma factor [Prosthecobacter sp.]
MNPELKADSTAAPFLTTRWTRVRLAKGDSEEGRLALADLCEAYYEPVVAYLRCVLRDADEARDLSHAFFAEILAGGRLGTADAGRGRFRSYLLGAVKHFVSHQREAARRLKRGGGASVIGLDDEEAAGVADARQPSPDTEFDRQWAITVITRSMAALRAWCEAEGRGEFFEKVGGLLSGQAAHGDQTALAAECGMTFDAFRMAVTRLKKRLRQSVQEEVAGTLDDPATVQDEMAALFAALSG